jgi:hypothetical protein
VGVHPKTTEGRDLPPEVGYYSRTSNRVLLRPSRNPAILSNYSASAVQHQKN